MKILIERTKDGKKFPLPKYATEHSSGIDLLAAIADPITLKIGDILLIPTGIKLKIPIHYEGQVRPRSGLALLHGVSVLNSPGTIDADFRGEIKVILINQGKNNFKIEPGMRIAQLVIMSLPNCVFEEGVVNTFETKRNKKGFGSTGIKVKSKNA